VTTADIEALLAPIQFHEVPQGMLFDMQNGLRQYYRVGAKISAVFINDRYIVDCQFKSLAEHLTLIQEYGTVKDVPVLIFTEIARDATCRANQKDYAEEIKYRFPNTSVRLLDHYSRMVEHQRFIIIAREGRTFSRLTMDPGIDVISRHQRDTWPAGPVFQRTELYYVQDYNPSDLNQEALLFLQKNRK